jgi:hypothetical protein
MNIEEQQGFIKVSRKKKNVKNIPKLTLKNNQESNNNYNKDDGIFTASPTESEESLEVRLPEEESTVSTKSKNKKKKKKSKKSKSKSSESTCGYEASNEQNDRGPDSPDQSPQSSPTFYDKHVVNVVPNPGCITGEIQHRRRRISSRCSEGEEVKSIHWAPELVLEPSRVRTSSAGSILSKSKSEWDEDYYECDCGVAGCSHIMSNRPKWISRSLRWKPRFSALASMRLDELNNVEQKFLYCDKQTHLKLGSGKIKFNRT